MNTLFMSVLLITFAVLIILFFESSPRHGPSNRNGEQIESNTDEWPVLAKPRDRNDAFMIKAMLEESDIKVIVEEDTTLGVLYGAQSIVDYPIRVNEEEFSRAQTLLEESTFSSSLQEKRT